MNHMTSSDSQISENATQDYTGNVSERLAQNRTLTSPKSTVHCITARAQNSPSSTTDALNERPRQNSRPVTESMNPNSTETLAVEDYTNASKNIQFIPATTLAEISTNSTETTIEVVPTIQQVFTSSTIPNTTESINMSTSPREQAKIFWLSKMTPNRSTAGTATTVQRDVSSHPDGMAFIWICAAAFFKLIVLWLIFIGESWLWSPFKFRSRVLRFIHTEHLRHCHHHCKHHVVLLCQIRIGLPPISYRIFFTVTVSVGEYDTDIWSVPVVHYGNGESDGVIQCEQTLTEQLRSESNLTLCNMKRFS